MAPYLQAEDLNVSFGGLRALRDCSFTVAPERITCLVGPNGAGKTTIFNVITGYTADPPAPLPSISTSASRSTATCR